MDDYNNIRPHDALIYKIPKISTSAASPRKNTLFDDTLKNLRSGLDEDYIIFFLINIKQIILYR